jgi:hypothetical protein
MRRLFAALIIAACCAPLAARASVVDASAAEAAYQAGDYVKARELFTDAVEQFRTASKDSGDYLVYREASYLYDRLADCAFVKRDWPGLKQYCDGLLVVSLSERNLIQEQLSGALASGIATASARYLAKRLDESVRIHTIVQAKRSIALILLDSNGTGAAGDGAIAQYQQLALACKGVYELDHGLYTLDIPKLEQRLDQFDAVLEKINELGDINELWAKYPPEGGGTEKPEPGKAGKQPPAKAPPAK